MKMNRKKKELEMVERPRDSFLCEKVVEDKPVEEREGTQEQG